LNAPSLAAATGAQKNELILFYTLMAVASTIITTPALRYFMPRAGLQLQA
jgi:hypothetical protein